MLMPARPYDLPKGSHAAFENCQKLQQPRDQKKPKAKYGQDIQYVQFKIIPGEAKIIRGLVYEGHRQCEAGDQHERNNQGGPRPRPVAPEVCDMARHQI